MTNLPLRGFRALISGAGVAGPALAYWLARYGATTTVVEVAPALRTTGFDVDFRGPTHLGVLDKMGILAELREIQTDGGAMTWVDENGREIFNLPKDFAGGDLEVRRCDLSRVLYEHRGPAEYLFDNSVTNIEHTDDEVRVDFARTESRTFDIVIGADGMHSAVRGLIFGAESSYVRRLGYYIAGWHLANKLNSGPVPRQYNVPGRLASVGADQRDLSTAVALTVFAADEIDYDRRDIDQQKKLIVDAFTGLRWRVPDLLDTLHEAKELYFDSISRASVPHWSIGRTALLGDAAGGVTLGGMGVGTGLVGAYVLAGELALVRGDHRSAFAAYERRLRRYTGRLQRAANPGQFLAPSTRTRLCLRNSLFKSRLVRRLLVSSSTSLATEVDLPDYPSLVG